MFEIYENNYTVDIFQPIVVNQSQIGYNKGLASNVLFNKNYLVPSNSSKQRSNRTCEECKHSFNKVYKSGCIGAFKGVNHCERY